MKKYVLYSSQYFFNLDIWMFQLVMLVGISICDKGILVYWMYSNQVNGSTMEVQFN